MAMVPFTIEKFRGLRNVGRPQKYGKGQFQIATNVDVDNDDIIRRRAGSSLVYPGTTGALITNGTDLLFREGADLKRLEANGTATTLRTGFGPNLRPLASCLIDGRLYYSDGELMGVYQDGRSRSWGLDIPPAPSVSETVGGLLSGIYRASLTYLRNDGQESGASKPVGINVTQGGIRLTVTPSSDPDVVGICLYLTPADGKVFWRQGVLENASATVTVAVRVVSYGLRLLTLNKRAPYPGDAICFYRGRLYIANGPEIRYTDFTETPNYELVDADRNTLPFESDVRMMAPVESGIWVGTEKEVMMLFGNDPHAEGGFQIKSLNSIGVIKGAWTVVDHSALSVRGLTPGPVAMFLSKDGVFIGDSAGNLMNLTGDYFVPPDGEEGWACLVKEPAMDRVFFGMKSGVGHGSAAVVVSVT